MLTSSRATNMPAALEALHVLVREEEARAPGLRVACVLNGDWHWLDADAEAFAAVQRLASPPLIRMRGNVETEIARFTGGCGCNYPANIAVEETERSNAIAAQLFAASMGRWVTLGGTNLTRVGVLSMRGGTPGGTNLTKFVVLYGGVGVL